MHQIIMFLRRFSPALKNCKKLFSHKMLYKWYKYIISLQNYIIKLTSNVLIKMQRPYICHVHRSWCFWHLLQSGDIDIKKRNISVLYLKLQSSNLALSNDTTFSISLLNSQLNTKCRTRTPLLNLNKFGKGIQTLHVFIQPGSCGA